jgi:hypothetical protein
MRDGLHNGAQVVTGWGGTGATDVASFEIELVYNRVHAVSTCFIAGWGNYIYAGGGGRPDLAYARQRIAHSLLGIDELSNSASVFRTQDCVEQVDEAMRGSIPHFPSPYRQ